MKKTVREKQKCIDSLRHNEYYDMQKIIDKLYQDSLEGKEFTNIMSQEIQ